MSEDESRQIARDSLFVMADLRLVGSDAEYRVRVRNLSSGGLMAEGGPKVVLGQTVSLNVRNLGWIDGSVAWVQDNRYGIAFHEEIDPRLVREPEASGEPDYRVRRPASALNPSEPGRLRKI
jgi:PilZ domain